MGMGGRTPQTQNILSDLITASTPANPVAAKHYQGSMTALGGRTAGQKKAMAKKNPALAKALGFTPAGPPAAGAVPGAPAAPTAAPPAYMRYGADFGGQAGRGVQTY